MAKKYAKCPYCDIEVSINESKMHVRNEHLHKYDEFRTDFEDWKKTTSEEYVSAVTPDASAEATVVEAKTEAPVAEVQTEKSLVDSLKARSEIALKQLKSTSEKVVSQVKPVSRKAYTRVRTTVEKAVGQTKLFILKTRTKT